MASTDYNQDQSGLRSELDEPRRTTENDVDNTGFDAPGQQQERSGDFPSEQGGGGYGGVGEQDRGTDFPSEQGGGGYGGVSEQEPPRHKNHTDDELLPKPTSGTYDDEGAGQEEPRDEQVLPSGTGSGYGGDSAPQSTENYQDFRSDQPQGLGDDTSQSQPRSFGQEKTGGYSDPSSAFPGAPVDRQLQEPGYGQDAGQGVQASDPVGTDAGLDSPTPKKEGLVQKIKDKLPGHHKASTPEAMEDDSPTGTGTPKKGLITKIKDKLPGHHGSSTPTVE